MFYLTVSDLWVAVSVGGEDSPERGDAGGVLESRVVRQRTVQVALDLIRSQVAVAHRLLHQAGVVALVGVQLGARICTKTDRETRKRLTTLKLHQASLHRRRK